MKNQRHYEKLSVAVSAGYGSAVVNAAGSVRQVAVIAPTSQASYDVAAFHAFGANTYGTMGRTGLVGNSTINEGFTCLTGSTVEIQNATTDGTYYLVLFGELG